MLRLFDTLSGGKRPFKPLGGRKVGIYTCGPSVYSYSHIGNFRTYLFEDVLVRYLIYKGYRIRRVMNITDVEDKAVQAARKSGQTLGRLERDKIRAFFRDYSVLGMLQPDVVAKASLHVPMMAGLIGRICRAGFCIEERDGVYFDVRRFPGYGRLRRLKSRRYMGKAANDDYSREGLWDFRLWKRWTRGDGKTGWDSPFGFGRPGWHIECSAMAMHYLGERFDIHCGGTDNIFPHHENEIAQSQAATGKMPANFWLHAKHLTIGRRKMSKRTGNVLFVRDLLDIGAHPECIRYYLISKSYRKRLDFTLGMFEKKVCVCERTTKLLSKLRRLGSAGRRQAAGAGRDGGSKSGAELAMRLRMGFESAMDDDLDTGLALRRIFSIFKEIDASLHEKKLSPAGAREIIRAMRRIDSVLGLFV